MSIDFQQRFYREPYSTEFTARVTACSGPDQEGRWAITLDDSCFYPEGGGQPGDRGLLLPLREDGSADAEHPVRVVDTVYQKGQAVQLGDAPLAAGTPVQGQLDALRRLTLMQQHSGEHLISGLAKQFYGCENVGFHISEEEMTLDFNKVLDAARIERLENAVNEAVFADLPIEISFPAPAELAEIDYRSKKELSGAVRLIHVPNVDSCACCGTHLRRTGEIGLVKIVRWEHYKSGVRLHALCGRRALADYQILQSQAEALSQAYSAKTRELLPEAVRPLALVDQYKAELGQRERDFLRLLMAEAPERPLLWLDARLDKLRAKDLAKWGVARGLPLLAIFVPKARAAAGGEELRQETAEPSRQAAAASSTCTYTYVLAGSQPLETLHTSLQAAFAAHGGGHGGFFQGQCQASREALQAFFAKELPELRFFATIDL